MMKYNDVKSNTVWWMLTTQLRPILKIIFNLIQYWKKKFMIFQKRNQIYNNPLLNKYWIQIIMLAVKETCRKNISLKE